MAFDLDNTLVARDRAFWRFLEHERARAPDRSLDLQEVEALDRRGHGPKEPLLAYLAEALGWNERELAARHQRFAAGLVAALEPDDAPSSLLSRLVRKYPLALISNGTSAVQRAKLARLELTSYFEQVLISQEVGLRKPDPAIFRRLFETWRLPPATVAFVGDDPHKDVLAAGAVGLVPIWISDGRSWPLEAPAPHTISSLDELEPLLDRLACTEGA
jgi:putative hydrolase of the HAD superfamily